MSPSDEVAADFKDALQDLKLNSRPEISNLTVIAKENTEYAQAISRELENHIRTTRPEWKLPALYVLDSIVKNVGTPYTVYLGRNLYRTFMDAYLVINDATRKAMEGLLRTWKQPVPDSMDPHPVFSPEVTGDIENALNKFRSAFQPTPVARPMHALPPRPATNAIWRNTPPLPLPPPLAPAVPVSVPVPVPAPAPVPAPTPVPAPISVPIPAPVPAPAPIPAAAPAPTNNLAELLAQYSKHPVQPPAPAIQPAQNALLPFQPPPPPALSWLLNTFQGLPHSTNLTNATPSTYGQMSQPTIPGPEKIELTTESLTQPRYHLISTLYEARSNRCSTCGRRFENTAEGKEKKVRHLDWHFKVKDPEAAKRIIHRSWYIGEKEWVDYREMDETSPDQTNSGVPGSVTAVKRQAKDRYVHVPQDIALMQAPCPICQEKFNPQWLMEANDWVWMDALKVGGKIYHATCYEEYCKGADIAMPSTPDSVLGKRKAEVGTPASGKKVRAH